MGRKYKQAEPVRRPDVEIKSSAIYAAGLPALLHRCLCTILLLCLVLLTQHGLAQRAPDDRNQPPSVPKSGSIEISKSSPQLMQYRFPGKKPQGETPLEFKGDGQDWSFIQFDNLPANVSLRTKGQPDGYGDAELIQAQKWYWFKSRLPLILEIKESALTPVNIYFWFGTLNNERDKDAAKQMKAEEMRAFTDSHEIKPISQKMTLNFGWESAGGGAGPTTAETSNVSNANGNDKGTNNPPPEPGWWEYFTETQPELGIIVLILSVALVAFLGIYVIPNMIWRIRDSSIGLRLPFSKQKHKKGLQAPSTPKAKPAAAKAKPATDTDMYAGLGAGAASKTGQDSILQEQTVDDLDSTSSAQATESLDEITLPGVQTQPTQENPNRRYGPGDVALPPSRPAGQAAAPVVGQDGNKLGGLESRLVQLENQLGRKVDRDEKLTPAVHAQINSMLVQAENNILSQVEKTIRQNVGNALKPVEDFMTEQAAAMEKKLNETVSGTEKSVEQMRAEGDGLKTQLEAVLTQLGQVEQRVQARLDELNAAMKDRTVPGWFIDKTLGAALGQNIEELQEGNFERLMGERLNRFFQIDVARGEKLEELRRQAEGINAALKEVSAQMASLKPQVTEDARPHLQQFQTFTDELSELQSQLQKRRGLIEAKLFIPVSLHGGARQDFLDALGYSIKRVMDKLAEPESYFEGQLERLITAHLIAVVDICDQKVAPPPGSHRELENTLKQLFDQAGLRQILPREREPFKTAEQDLIEMDQSGKGPSLTIAKVTTRGFYYKHGENETLLRKAGVIVYR